MEKYTPWEDYEKYRAEQHKQLGCLFSTPLAAMILEMFIGNPPWDYWYLLKFSAAIISARLGWFYIDKSFKIMYTRERNKLYATYHGL